MTRHLTADELCTAAGLTPTQFGALHDAQLLVPDREQCYRARLVNWARKLAYLLGDGWMPDEVAAWANGRWATPTPLAWPPRRADWISQGLRVLPRTDSGIPQGSGETPRKESRIGVGRGEGHMYAK